MLGPHARSESSCGADPLLWRAFTIREELLECYAKDVGRRVFTAGIERRHSLREHF